MQRSRAVPEAAGQVLPKAPASNEQQHSGLDLKHRDAQEDLTPVIKRTEQEELPAELSAPPEHDSIPPQAVSESSSGPQRRTEAPSATAVEPQSAPAEVEEPRKIDTPKSRDISLQLTSAKNERVEVRLAERMGEVVVTVRTADPHLKNGLQENLSELAHRLDAGGYRAEFAGPGAGGFSSAHEGARHGGGDSDSSGSRHGGQHSDGGHPGSQQDQRRNNPAFDWSEEMEKVL